MGLQGESIQEIIGSDGSMAANERTRVLSQGELDSRMLHGLTTGAGGLTDQQAQEQQRKRK